MGTATVAFTPADLLAMPPRADGKDYELSDGELIVVSKAGARHELVKGRVIEALVAYKIRHSVGAMFSESMFTLGPETARIPDVAFVLNHNLDRIPEEDVPIPIAPDIAIEVISASESAADAEKTVREYLNAGVAEVWQIYPEERSVRVRTKHSIRDVEAGETLTTPVLSGFSVLVDSFFSR